MEKLDKKCDTLQENGNNNVNNNYSFQRIFGFIGNRILNTKVNPLGLCLRAKTNPERCMSHDKPCVDKKL